MAIVRLTNKSQITKPEAKLSDTAAIPGNEVLLLSRAIYQILGSLVRNQEMVTVIDNGDDTVTKSINWEKLPNEYKEFAEDMDRLWQHTFYPELALANNVPAPSANIIAANEYLGGLGNDYRYAYSKDFVNITPWLGTDDRTSMRVLFDEDDNTYLVDTDDNTVLVSYNT